tara:strand:- start:567 stop:1829 length:1263 start_codon:yes stop_codon:yes gene_type:complete
MIYFLLEKLNKIKKFPYIFVTPLIYAIGNACEEIKIAESYAYKNKKKLVILHVYSFQNLLKYRVCNKSIFNDLNYYKETNFEKSLRYILNFLIDKEFIFRRCFFLFIKRFTNKNLSRYNFPIIGIQQIFDDKYDQYMREKKFENYNKIKKFHIKKNNFDLNYEKNLYCKNKLKKFHIPYEKLILVHVRDNNYRNDKGRKSYRNSNINTYIESIKYLIKKGYFVIRAGRKPSKKINFKSKNFLDYSKLDTQEDIIDLYLMKKCKYFIGTQSGILDLAQLFYKPVLTTNMVEIYSKYPFKSNDRGIFKQVKRRGDLVKINDFVKLNFKYHNPTTQINDLTFIDNDEEEIYYSLIEFLKVQKNSSLSLKQKRFNNFLKKEHKKHYINTPYEMFTEYDSMKVVRLVKNNSGCLTNINLKKLKFK